jgi:hypothetical protein
MKYIPIILLLFSCSLFGQKFTIDFDGELVVVNEPPVYTVYWVLKWVDKIEQDRIINNDLGRTPIKKLTGQTYIKEVSHYDTLSRVFTDYDSALYFLMKAKWAKEVGKNESFYKEKVFDVWADFIGFNQIESYYNENFYKIKYYE